MTYKWPLLLSHLSLSLVNFQGSNEISIEIVSSTSKWSTRIWWNSLGRIDFFVDGHRCRPISLHCPLKSLLRLKKHLTVAHRPFSIDHSILSWSPWIHKFSSLIEKIGPNSKLAGFSSSNCSTIKVRRLRWSRRNPFSLMSSGDSILGSSRDHLDMLTRSDESKIFAVSVKSHCRFP